MADNTVNWDWSRCTGAHGLIWYVRFDISERNTEKHGKGVNRGQKLGRNSWICGLWITSALLVMEPMTAKGKAQRDGVGGEK